MKRRQTYQKQEILNIIQGIGTHMTAEEVKSALDQKETGIGLATVYRNLNLLVQEGVIRKYTGEGYNFYNGNPAPHDHLRCTKCGKMIDLGEMPYDSCPDEKVEKFTGGKVFSHVTIFEGICKDCLNEEDTSNGIKGFKN